MGTNVPPGDIFQGGGGDDFMPAAIKLELCAGKVPLAIIGAKPKGHTKFGDFTGFTVVVGGQGPRRGERYLIGLGWNEIREQQAQSCLEAFGAGATSIGPVFLSQIPTKSGNMAWVLGNEPHEGAVAEMKGDDATAAPDAIVPGADDIPF